MNAAGTDLAACLDRLFAEARTFSHWQTRDVPDAPMTELARG